MHGLEEPGGAYPYAGLLIIPGDALYGTAESEGPMGGGTVFRLSVASPVTDGRGF